MQYESQEVVSSRIQEGVSYTVQRMSFVRRLDLMKRVKALLPKLECYQAGSTGLDRLEAAVLSAEIDKLYLEWGLVAVSGLQIDGCAADPVILLTRGPEDILAEALQCVKQACRLSGAEIKN